VGKKSLATLTAVALAFSLLAVPFANAAEVTREAYKEQVEPICKANVQANEKILKGVRSKVQAGKLKAAGTQFSQAANALHKAYVQLKAVPQPTADEAKLGKWLGYVQQQEVLFRKGGNQLKAGNENGAQQTVIRLTRNANQANNQVVPFEFKYCRFEPSKFT
jgi:hypothetical protein